MWFTRRDFTVLCVWVVVGLCGANRRAKIDQEAFRSQEPSGDVKRSLTHFVYPRTGRLFHADYVRDNEIFKSLDRTNFMRRGPFAQRILLEKLRRTQEAVGNVEKHVYIGEGRIPVKSKKGVLVKETDNPRKAVLFKVSKVVDKEPVMEKRFKRNTISEENSTEEAVIPMGPNPTALPGINKQNNTDNSFFYNKTDINKKEEKISVTENKVDCDNISSPNNDVDKTLFVHDAVSHESLVPSSSSSVETPTVDVNSGNFMKKTVMDDSLKLYPVYRGVKYYYPQAERKYGLLNKIKIYFFRPIVCNGNYFNMSVNHGFITSNE